MQGHLLYASQARYHLRETAKTFSPGCSRSERVEAYRTFCLSLQMIAYAALLGEAEPSGFFLGLTRMARNWKALLEYANSHAWSSEIPASLNTPLLGAIASNQLGLARELAALSSRERARLEYDDEFLGAFFLQRYILERPLQPPGRVALMRLCDRADAYLDRETPRFSALRALAAGEVRGFWENFQAWNEEHFQQVMARAEAPGAPLSLGITRYIWLEGLAVMRLAELEGFTHPRRYFRLIPELVRAAPSEIRDDDVPLLGGSFSGNAGL